MTYVPNASEANSISRVRDVCVPGRTSRLYTTPSVKQDAAPEGKMLTLKLLSASFHSPSSSITRRPSESSPPARSFRGAVPASGDVPVKVNLVTSEDSLNLRTENAFLNLASAVPSDSISARETDAEDRFMPERNVPSSLVVCSAGSSNLTAPSGPTVPLG